MAHISFSLKAHYLPPKNFKIQKSKSPNKITSYSITKARILKQENLDKWMKKSNSKLEMKICHNKANGNFCKAE